MKTSTLCQKDFENCVSKALKSSVLHSVPKVVNYQEFMLLFSEAVIDSSGFITPVAALVRSKQRNPVAEQAEIESTFPQLEGTGMTVETHPAPESLGGGNQPPTDTSDDKGTSEPTPSISANQISENN